MRHFIFILLSLPVALFAQADSLLTTVLWEEITRGERNGITLRFDEFGPFEEDAGEDHQQASRYLLGRWELDTTSTRLTFAVDYFLGRKLVHPRYRRGKDFYLEYRIVTFTRDTLELEDELTGKVRRFVAVPLDDRPDASERRAQKIELGTKKDNGGFKIPDGW